MNDFRIGSPIGFGRLCRALGTAELGFPKVQCPFKTSISIDNAKEFAGSMNSPGMPYIFRDSHPENS